MFRRGHHNRIAHILDCLNSDLLRDAECYFGGGTAIALRFGEFRESVDIDFLISSTSGYRHIRELVKSQGIAALTIEEVPVVRAPRADQYGIRTIVEAQGVPIKVEIVSEGRIAFETPGPEDQVRGVATLTCLDLAASKLLANSDHWADTSVFSRDLIDLAMMEPGEMLADAIGKSSVAYGKSVAADLTAAIDFHRDNPQRLDQCMQALGMHTTPRQTLWERIERLRQ